MLLRMMLDAEICPVGALT